MGAPAKKSETRTPATVLTVTAQLVQLRVGDRVVHLHVGDIVPANAEPAGVDHLRDLGFVAESDAPVDFNSEK